MGCDSIYRACGTGDAALHYWQMQTQGPKTQMLTNPSQVCN
uniref:Uncharacterized protein n=1 Tax=Anguilla anguilla TaxID=7936 RepID=A0A0E9SRP2_ANGAN